MKKLYNQNKPMAATVISGFLIALGIFLNYMNFELVSVISYLSAFSIGGYYQAKEGIFDLVKNKHLNVDVLMILAAVGASLIGYWLEGAILIFIFSLSGSLEVYTTNKSTKAISNLMSVTPEKAKVIQKDGSIKEVFTKELNIGDQLMVPKGTSIPIDGELKTDYALINESAISGEPVPVNKKKGDTVIGGTINLEKSLNMEVTKKYSDTLFAKVIRLVEEAQGTPSKTASKVEGIENFYVKIVLCFVPIMILLFYFVFNWSISEAFYRGMILLTVASPCALMASVSPATLSAISNGARKGVLFKGGSFLENISEVKAIAFDKTGTVTEGRPKVTDIEFVDSQRAQVIKQVLVQMERTSSHPLAQAIVEKFEKDIDQPEIRLTDIVEIEGRGLEGVSNGKSWKIGKKSFAVKENKHFLVKQAEKRQKEGKTIIYITENDRLAAFVALLDTPAQGAKEMIEYFKDQGIYTIMITGDNPVTAKAIGDTLGVEEVRANYLPDEKAKLILDLKEQYGTIMMVGDGINDAPALANASIGIAMGTGTDIAIESADIVLVKNELNQLIYSHRLSKRLSRITMQNISFSIMVIGVLISVNLFQLINLPLGVIGHEGSTILVILNGLRLLK